MMEIMTINQENFEEKVLKAEKPVVLDFWAPWCGYCKRLNPVIERLAEQYDGSVLVGKTDIDDSEALAEQFEVDTIPTLILFQGGKASEPIVNPGSASAIENWMKENGAI